jgi:predicted ATPase with chaperone activity
VLKQLYHLGGSTGADLARRLGVDFSVIEPTLVELRSSHQCEILGAALIGAPSYRYRITDEGRRRAQLLLAQSRYVGVAPVPLAQYCAYLEAYRARVVHISNRQRMRQAFSHLVLSDRVLDQVGTALASGHSMFVYGPAGNGKTVIAQGLGKLLEGEIAIPHALEVDGQLMRLFDPVNHHPIPEAAHSVPGLVSGPRLDARWVRCSRPLVTVGGELTLDSLELTYSSDNGFYTPPIQALANGGVLVIDDFGRQQCSPRQLLNRWIVPLESRVDYLTLNTGQKFMLPFMVLVVFATNLRPSDLVDDAFLRRVQFKVLAENPTLADIEKIFEKVCHDRQVQFDPALVRYLIENIFRPRRIQPRGCHPRDLIHQALAHASYAGLPRELTPELLEAACASYFVDDAESTPGPTS